MIPVPSRTAEAIRSRFTVFLHWIQPARDDLQVGRIRVQVIKQYLRGTFDVARVAVAGSFLKGTAIRGHSDLDLFVVLTRDEVRWGGSYMSSTTVLNNIRLALQRPYPNSAVGRDGSAITIAYTKGPSIDVVPAVYEGPGTGGFPLYSIPDGNGGWMLTSPDLQRREFLAANAASGSKLARVVQAVKWWARDRANPLPISAYYVEMVLAQAGVAAGVNRYSSILASAFAVLSSRGTTALNDPLGISGRIRPARTAIQADTVAAALAYAARHAAAAWQAEQYGETKEAIRQWRIVFDRFPA